jgi:hypothetical protein
MTDTLTAISRREFVRGAVCAAAGTTLVGLSRAFAAERGSLSKEVMREFPYGAVRLTGGPMMRPAIQSTWSYRNHYARCRSIARTQNSPH